MSWNRLIQIVPRLARRSLDEIRHDFASLSELPIAIDEAVIRSRGR